MDERLYEPLKFYESYGKAEHDKNVREYFESLVSKSRVDAAANKATVAKYNQQMERVNHLDKKLKRYKVLRVFMIIFIVIAFIFALAMGGGRYFENAWDVIIPVISVGVAVGLIVLTATKIKRVIKNFKDLLEKATAKAEAIKREAWSQVAPLLSLFDDYDTVRLIEKTVPDFDFDREWSVKQEAHFTNNYSFRNVIDDNSTVIDTLTGRFTGNPFLFERYKTQTMEPHTYHGTKVIHWTTTYRGSDGKTHTKHHTQTLHASVTKPKPVYKLNTVLHYGHHAAPDLNFSREHNHVEDLSERALERRIAAGERELRKKAEEALENNQSFTEMANAKFEVLFGAQNRDHEQQFRLMFTPLAQTGMTDLMLSEVGYGDDFRFVKQGRHNMITSEHAQSWDMDSSAKKYYSYDLEQMRNTYVSFNNEFFKSVFFDLAPLITIPAYQDSPSKTFEDVITKYDDHCYTQKEYEVLANRIGAKNFAHADTATDVILKTFPISTSNGVDRILISAYSFRAIPHTDIIPRLGGDGRMHGVPVVWYQYVPISRESEMAVKSVEMSEDDFAEGGATVNTNAPRACYHGFLAVMNGTDSKMDYQSIFNSLKK